MEPNHKAKQPPQARDLNLEELETQLGYHFLQPELLATAMTHSSFINEYDRLHVEDNQRLEFLGDAVVQLVVSHSLMGSCPGETEGRLTKLRARVVNTEGLAEAARRIGLGDYLRLGRGESLSGGQARDSLLADAFEAMAGALFLDGGYDVAARVLLPLLLPQLNHQQAATSLLDCKSRLQEVTQASFACLPAYEVTGQSGPEHAKLFQVSVTLRGHLWGVGTGGTKKAAEQAAAATALAWLDRQLADHLEPAVDRPPPEANAESPLK